MLKKIEIECRVQLSILCVHIYKKGFININSMLFGYFFKEISWSLVEVSAFLSNNT